MQGLARLGIFRDFSTSELVDVVNNLHVVTFLEGERIIHAGQENASFYIIVEGEAGVYIDDVERDLLGRGSFFGEISALLGDPATADILTRTELLCLEVPASALEGFLTANPRLTFRMLQVEARRLQFADRFAHR